MDADSNTLLLALGKSQIDAMFRRQEEHAADDSEFLPFVEVVLNAFETVGTDKKTVDEIWGVCLRRIRPSLQRSRSKFHDRRESQADAKVPLGAKGPEAEASKKEPLT